MSKGVVTQSGHFGLLHRGHGSTVNRTRQDL